MVSTCWFVNNITQKQLGWIVGRTDPSFFLILLNMVDICVNFSGIMHGSLWEKKSGVFR